MRDITVESKPIVTYDPDDSKNTSHNINLDNITYLFEMMICLECTLMFGIVKSITVLSNGKKQILNSMNLNNGIALCRQHHLETHGKYLGVG